MIGPAEYLYALLRPPEPWPIFDEITLTDKPTREAQAETARYMQFLDGIIS